MRCSVSMLKALLATQPRAATSCSPKRTQGAVGSALRAPRAGSGIHQKGRIFSGSGVGLPREREHGECLTRKHLNCTNSLDGDGQRVPASRQENDRMSIVKSVLQAGRSGVLLDSPGH